ncbi:carbon-nitrogen hydrolase [Helicobacter sp. MIT 14-3879]|uniref:carbon-nitrogen hydrolase n=1 Tax=Helicobacter sp. MIT 14-3879 TaxID=2040649 RepID=UPI000E1EB38C|nr:carbon-nitrogen hydrolase [Helicobacter sp. MIT 14-3879]RDU64875.1 carbon-nitrogen hydrolase [Helicobacter sp. MIT 14-3879]
MNIALLQHSFKGNKKESIDFTLKMITKASKNGADLIALQELHTNKYFCQCEDVKYFKYAKEFEKEVNIFSEAAKYNNVVLVSSLFEQRAKGLYHNTAVVFDKDGSIAGKYRKMHIPDDPSFYEKFYFTPGDNDFTPIKTSIGKLGVLICWDQWYPEAARLMALGGADILIYPTAIGYDLNDTKDEQKRQLDAWLGVQRGHAIANGIFVVGINRCGIEYEEKNKSKINFWGNSFIFGPQGEIIKLASENKDEIIKAKIDLKRIEKVRNIWPFLRDRRIEYYNKITKRYID